MVYRADVDKIPYPGIGQEQDQYIISLTDVGNLSIVPDLEKSGRRRCCLRVIRSMTARIFGILHYFEQQQFIDPRTIYATAANDHQFVFPDRRHRPKVSYLLGCEQILVGVESENMEIMQTMIRFGRCKG